MTDDPNKIQEFMKDVLPKLEAADHVDRYAWFASRFATQVSVLVFLMSKLTSLFVSGLGKLAVVVQELPSSS